MSSALTVLLKPNHGATRALYCPPSEQILFFARRFIAHSDRILTLLALLDKVLLDQVCEFSPAEDRMREDDLQLRLLKRLDSTQLVDRNGSLIDAPTLLYLRDQIFNEAEKRALAVYQRPSLHPDAKAFKQVLAQAGDKELSDAHAAILREAFLYHHQGQLYTLRGTWLKHRSRSQRWVWRVLHG